jgi:hypothetical protein
MLFDALAELIIQLTNQLSKGEAYNSQRGEVLRHRQSKYS